MDRAVLLRPTIKQRIEDMIDMSTDDPVEGKVYIVYERLGDLKWLPGKGDGESWRGIKHWRLVIQLGFDWFTLEFLENSLISRQGIVIVNAFDPANIHRPGAKVYALGKLTMSSEEMFSWIQKKFHEWTYYNLRKRNCQHFVRTFFQFVQGKYLSQETQHFRDLQRRSGRMLGGFGLKSRSSSFTSEESE
jgi:hypothetical protein